MLAFPHQVCYSLAQTRVRLIHALQRCLPIGPSTRRWQSRVEPKKSLYTALALAGVGGARGCARYWQQRPMPWETHEVADRGRPVDSHAWSVRG